MPGQILGTVNKKSKQGPPSRADLLGGLGPKRCLRGRLTTLPHAGDWVHGACLGDMLPLICTQSWI